MVQNVGQLGDALVAHGPAQQIDDEGRALGVDQGRVARVRAVGNGPDSLAEGRQFLFGDVFDGLRLIVEKDHAFPQLQHDRFAVHIGDAHFHMVPLVMAIQS